MQEIEVKENPLKVKAFINGIPELKISRKKKRRVSSPLWNRKFVQALKKMQHKTTYFPNFV